jgi:hypothetical protein
VRTLDLPEYGRHGQLAAGFFGFLPQYLNASNYHTEIIEEELTQAVLDRNDVLVFINLDETLSSPILDMIWRFVEEGGSLLVMGDHTDLSGIMNPLNSLLDPVGIRFNFDSAIPIKQHWKSCFQLLHHPVTEGIQTTHDISLSVGASLDLSKSAFPIIYGKGAFSDIGDYLNFEGSYLGDYELNPDEQLSDVVLVAGAYYGEGKVVVFGDTSSFQNIALLNAYPLINNVFSWLSSNNTAVSHYSRLIFAFIFLFLAIFIYRKLNKKFFVLFPLAICISLLFSNILNQMTTGERELSGPICYIDVSHGEPITRDHYQRESVSGLKINLGRNEYSEGERYLSPILLDFSEKKLFNAKMLVLIAPIRQFSSDEVELLERFMTNGGLIILSVGYNDKQGSNLILDHFGFDIIAKPLGPVPYIEEDPLAHQYEPRFVDSWPISIQEYDNETRIFYSITFDDDIYPLVVYKKIGDGGILLISDSQFLLDYNLETLSDYWPGNVIFLRDVLEELKKEGVPQ